MPTRSRTPAISSSTRRPPRGSPTRCTDEASRLLGRQRANSRSSPARSAPRTRTSGSRSSGSGWPTKHPGPASWSTIRPSDDDRDSGVRRDADAAEGLSVGEADDGDFSAGGARRGGGGAAGRTQGRQRDRAVAAQHQQTLSPRRRVVQTVVLWNTRDLGYLAVYASALVNAAQAGAPAPGLQAGRLGADRRARAARSSSVRRCCSTRATSNASISRPHAQRTQSGNRGHEGCDDDTDSRRWLRRSRAQRYADFGVDTDAALRRLTSSVDLAALLAGRRCRRVRGSGRNAGRRAWRRRAIIPARRARPTSSARDAAKALSLIPGRTVSTSTRSTASSADGRVERDAIGPEHFHRLDRLGEVARHRARLQPDAASRIRRRPTTSRSVASRPGHPVVLDSPRGGVPPDRRRDGEGARHALRDQRVDP